MSNLNLHPSGLFSDAGVIGVCTRIDYYNRYRIPCRLEKQHTVNQHGPSLD